MSSLPVVTLTIEEVVAASREASLQMARKILFGRRGDHGGQSKRSLQERWWHTFLGMQGEIALAKFLGAEWTPGGEDISTGDVANQIEVRTTDVEKGCLMVYAKDHDEAQIWLVRGFFPTFEIVGFITGKAAKQKEWFNIGADPPSYWVPDSSLNAPCSL